MNCPKIWDRFPAALILKSETLTPLPWGKRQFRPSIYRGFGTSAASCFCAEVQTSPLAA